MTAKMSTSMFSQDMDIAQQDAYAMATVAMVAGAMLAFKRTSMNVQAPEVSLVASRSKMTMLPTDMLQHVLSFVGHSDLHAVEQVSVASFRLVNENPFVWRQHALRSLVSSASTRHLMSFKQQACLAHRREQDSDLLTSIQGFSSEDRPTESVHNTLRQSKCWREFQNLAISTPSRNPQQSLWKQVTCERIQRVCGCMHGRACYWSSSPSSLPDASDYIDYGFDATCIVSRVQLSPYQVYWHPNNPTYGPQSISIEFRTKDGSVLYHSRRYSVDNRMTLQEFALGSKVLVTTDTVMRVNLIGRQQEQTYHNASLQGYPSAEAPEYYCCISYVGAVGIRCDNQSMEKRRDQVRKTLLDWWTSRNV